MPMIILTASILVLTVAVRLFDKVTSMNICPICAGVALTWSLSLAGQFTGLLSVAEFQLPTAILVGGSVVGIAYKLEGRLYAGASKLLWKALFIPSGFSLAYGLLQFDWLNIFLSSALLFIVTVCFWAHDTGIAQNEIHSSKAVKELTENMKSCC